MNNIDWTIFTRFQLDAPKSTQTGLWLDCYLSNVPHQFIKHMYQTFSNILAFWYSFDFEVCVYFQQLAFCSKITRRNHMIYSVAFKKAVWKYLNITNQTLLIILLFKSISSKAMNYCQRHWFQALITAISRIKSLILVIFQSWMVQNSGRCQNDTTEKVNIKGKKAGIVYWSQQKGNWITSVDNNTHQITNVCKDSDTPACTHIPTTV